MPKKDLHLTTEQLSTLIDGQLSPEEQVHCEKHLKTCQQCQQTRADLRLTIQALHALPRPVLPRSFVLPASSSITVEKVSASDKLIALPARPLPRRRPLPNAIRNSLRGLSTLAAVVGIVFLLSNMVIYISQDTRIGLSSTVASPAKYPANAPGSSPTMPSSTATAHPNIPGSDGKGAGTPGVSGNPNQGQPSQELSPTTPAWLLALNPFTSDGRALSGAILLALAIVGFLLLYLLRKRTGSG